ncbi:uncharacterized protein LOC108107190 [Drosophila eugracilis]|uniref:uncharacterized protein LOC108107190 n=1 Tax=Drosophila eugracilis TaxID=29029 RepID=UPI001BDAE067|nr:uncharacterized protein LOC108107190 [Drosophila eugracilis]
MSKRNWNRKQCSVHLPRSELVEIGPMMPSSSGSSSGASNDYPHLSFPKSNKGLLTFTDIGNKENTNTKSLGKLCHDWGNLLEAEIFLQETNEPLIPSSQVPSEVPKVDQVQLPDCIIISSTGENSADRKKGAVKKSSQRKIIPFGLGNVALLDTDTEPNIQVTPPEWNNRGSDLVFHQNLDNKISVKTVMPNFLSNLHGLPTTSTGTDPKSMLSTWIAPRTYDNDFTVLKSNNEPDSEIVVTELPSIPSTSTSQPPEKDASTEYLIITESSGDVFPIGSGSMKSIERDPMWSSTCISSSCGKKETSKGRKSVKQMNDPPQSVWRKDNLCETSLQAIQNSNSSQSSMESWRSIEAICMRLRGIDVPGEVGLLSETPTFEDIFDVLGIADDND